MLRLIVPLVIAQWIPGDYPNPLTDPTACGRQNRSHVCDPDHVIDQETANKLDYYIYNISQIVSPCGKYQMGIALCNSMDLHRMGVSATKGAEQFAQDLHNTWGVGNAGCNDGILFFLSKKDRKMYMSLGKTAKEKLTDGTVNEIMNNMKGCLKKGDYDCALLHMADDTEFILDNGTFSGDHKKDEGDGWLVLTILGSIFGSICLIMAVCGAIGGYMEEKRIERQIEYRRLQSKEKRDREKRKHTVLTEAFDQLDDITKEKLLHDFKIICGDLDTFLTDKKKFASTVCCGCTKTTTILECGHPVCKDCLPSDINCPVCRQNIYKPTMVHNPYTWEEFKYRMGQISKRYDFPIMKHMPPKRIYNRKLKLKPMVTKAHTVVVIKDNDPFDLYYFMLYTNDDYYNPPTPRKDYGSCSTNYHYSTNRSPSPNRGSGHDTSFDFSFGDDFGGGGCDGGVGGDW
jgi:uncharacterized membrane protein YgcG